MYASNGEYLEIFEQPKEPTKVRSRSSLPLGLTEEVVDCYTMKGAAAAWKAVMDEDESVDLNEPHS